VGISSILLKLSRVFDFSMLLTWFYRAIGPGTFNTSVLDFNCATIKLLEEWFPDLEDGTEFAFHDIITWQEHLYSVEGKRFQLSHFDDKDELEHNLNIGRDFINSFAGEVIGVLGEDVRKFVSKTWRVVTRGDGFVMKRHEMPDLPIVFFKHLEYYLRRSRKREDFSKLNRLLRALSKEFQISTIEKKLPKIVGKFRYVSTSNLSLLATFH
jgi:hypothetical protein